MDEELFGFNNLWEIEDLEEVIEEFGCGYCLYPRWVSTKEFMDTNERSGFLTTTDQGAVSQERDGRDDVLSDGLSDDEDAPISERVPQNTVMGMTASDR